MLITGKARFTIDLLQVAYKKLVLKQSDLRQSYETHDTPVFDRKQQQELLVDNNLKSHTDIGTGTFGKLGQITELDDLRQDNQNLRQELHMLKDQLKSVIGTMGTFRMQVAD